MIIKVFKTNQVIANVFIVLLAVALWIPGYYSNVVLNLDNHSLASFFIDNKFFNVFLTSLLIGFQGVFLNYVINNEKLIKGNTHLVGLFYVVMNSAVNILFTLNPIIISNTLIIAVLFLFCKTYSQNNAKSLLFNLGMLIGLCALIYAPLCCLFALMWFVLSYLRTPNIRDFFISLFGYALPFIYLFAYLYLTDNIYTSNYIDWMYYPAIFSVQILSKPFVYFLLVIIGFVTLAFFSLVSQLSRDVVKDRKIFIVIILLACVIMGSLYFNQEDFNTLYILLTIPFSVFLANYFNKLRKEWLAEVFFTIILLGILGSYFL